MPSSTDYEQKIAQYTRDGLLELWKAIESGNEIPGWEKGRALEYLVLRAFQLEGADVRWPYSIPPKGKPIEQIDGVIYSDGLSCLIECKDLNEKTGIEPIAKLSRSRIRRLRVDG